MYEYRKLKYRKYGMYGCTGHVAHFDYLFGIDRYSQWLYGKICIKNFHIYIYSPNVQVDDRTILQDGE